MFFGGGEMKREPVLILTVDELKELERLAALRKSSPGDVLRALIRKELSEHELHGQGSPKEARK
jgi:hypothetical protein